MTRLQTLLLPLSLLLLSGCVSVPDADRIVVSGATGGTASQDAPCSAPLPREAEQPGHHGALDPADLGLMIWNIHKAQHAAWPEDFLRLGTPMDILLLQEAHLTEPFSTTIGESGFRWSMAHAYTYAGAGTGVLTASRAPATDACLKRETEPLLRTPKSALITRHSVEGGGDLLLANLHGINFSLGTDRFRQQLQDVVDAVRPHQGPLILAGDFNDWSEHRSQILKSLTGELRLEHLALPLDVRSHHFGRPVDHVFYRDLEVLEADAVEVSSSDHNPLLVRFRIPAKEEGQQQ